MSPVIDVSDATFEQQVIDASRQGPVVVDFWAAWCGPCRALGPMLEDVVQTVDGVTLAKLDVDANPSSAMRFGVRGIPAVKAFRGGRVVDEFVGLQPRAIVERFIARLAPPRPESVPADESGLRAALDAKPDSLAARRALGALLLGEGRLEEAEAVLADAAHDAVSDGLLARAQLMRDAAGGLPAALHGPAAADDLSAMPDVIAAIRHSRPDAKSRLRRVALGVLAAQDDHAAEVEVLRRELAGALF